MAKAPPQFNFYYNDWLGGVAPLTPHQEQCYLRLLIQQWQDGYIPLTKAGRMAVCNITDGGLWDSLWSALRAKFEPFDLDDTTVAFRNARMHDDREHAINCWEQRRKASSKGVKARRKKMLTNRSTVRSTERCTVLDKDKDKDTSSTEESLSSQRSAATGSTHPPKARARFTPPTVAEVKAYADSKGWMVDAEAFVDFYESKGWRVGSAPMRSWTAALSRAREWDCNLRLQSKKRGI